jgi:hypothetical protein
MTRLAHAWRAMTPEQHLGAVAAFALLVTMFFPWYGLQSLNRKTGAIYSHNISAFGDVSFVEAAIFLVAAGVLAMLVARAEGRDFQMPGGDGMIVLIAGSWAGLLIFYRVFSRPDGNGYPVGIEWGFFLAFVAAGGLAFAGLRMRASEQPGAPLLRSRRRPPRTPPREPAPRSAAVIAVDEPDVAPARPAVPSPPARRRPSAPVPADARRSPSRPPYPPAPGPASAPEQLSFEDPPTRQH